MMIDNKNNIDDNFYDVDEVSDWPENTENYRHSL